MGKINSCINTIRIILRMIFLFILFALPFSIEVHAADNITLTWTGKGTQGDNSSGTYVDQPNLMVDGDNSTKWCGVSDSNTLSVSYKSEVPIIVTSYSLTQANDTATQAARNWQNWKIYGATSNLEINSEQWELIDEQNSSMTNLTYGYTQNFTVSGNNKYYQYFKVEVGVNALNNNKYRAQMAEFKLYGTKELPTVELGNTALNPTDLSKYSYPQALVTGTVNEVMITVDSGSFTASESYTVVNQDLTGHTKTYNVSNASQAQALIRSCEFTIAEGETQQKLKISLNGNETDLSIPAYANIKMTQASINGTNHYYAYVQLNSTNSYNNVANSISFSEAYAAAKQLKYNGLKGYLVTITSAEENTILDNLTLNMGWGGGGRVSQSDAALNGDTFYKSSSLIAPSSNTTWYWVCGPEAGETFSYTYWNNGEPNGSGTDGEYLLMLHLNNSGSSRYGWNDLNNSMYKLPGYFVEWSEDTRTAGEPSYYTQVNVTNSLHEHSCKHVAGTGVNSNKIYSYCSSNTTCPYYGTENDYSKAVAISINANNPTYVNSNNVIGWKVGQTIDFSITGIEEWKTKLGISTTPTINYKGISPTTYNSTEKPSSPGNYKACISIGDAEAYIKFEIGYEISFNNNGGEGEMTKIYLSPDSTQYILPGCTFTSPRGKDFDGWSTSPVGTKINASSYNISNNTILYAVWEKHEHQLKVSDMGNGISKVSCECGFYVIKYN